jgi:hypothetical protein
MNLVEASSFSRSGHRTMVDPILSLSTRTVSLAAFVLLVPVVASFRLAPGIWWAEYVGILYHLTMFLLVFKLPSPEWARAAGYGWLRLDVMAGAFMINHVPRTIAGNVRQTIISQCAS